MHHNMPYQPVARCFYCDTWLPDQDAIITPNGHIMCLPCAEDFSSRISPEKGKRP